MKMKKLFAFCVSIFLLSILLQGQTILQAEESYTLGKNSTYNGQATLLVPDNKAMSPFETAYQYRKAYEKVTKIIFKEGVTEVAKDFMGRFPNVKEVEIPANLTSFEVADTNQKLDTFDINKKNQKFKVMDGVLYCQYDKEYRITCYPATKQDTKYVVPDNVAIDHSIIYPLSYITEITLGSSEVSQYFLSTGIKEKFPNLSSIVMTSGNQKYCSKDGVVFSKDGKKLIAYPVKGGKNYQVPEGTVTIGSSAFEKTDIEEVTLPDGLTKVGELAFSDTPLKSVFLPDSLQTMEYGAFAGTHLETVMLPKNLKMVSAELFRDTELSQITVPKNCKYLSSYLGGIYNKSKTKLLWWPECNSRKVTKLVFPASLKELDYSLIENDKASAIVIPKKLVTITNTEDNQLKKVTIASGNKKFTVKNNVLYTRNMSMIQLYPNGSTARKVTFAEGLKTLNLDLFAGSNTVEILTLPKSLQTIESSYGYGPVPGSGFRKLTAIQLKKENRYFKVKDGILYDKSMKKLCWFPIDKKIKNYIMPSSVTEVDNVSLGIQNYVETISISPNCISVMPGDYDDGEAEDKFCIGLDCPKLKAINFANTATGYKSVDGVVFSKDGVVLKGYPQGKTNEEYTIPEGCRGIRTEMNNPYLKKLTLSSDMNFDYEPEAEQNMEGLTALERIIVPTQNQHLQSVDSVVYTKGKYVSMALFPKARKSDTLWLPADFDSISITKLAQESPYLKTIQVVNEISL